MSNGNIFDLCKIPESILNIYQCGAEQGNDWLLVVGLGRGIYLFLADVAGRVEESNRLVRKLDLFGLVTACDFRGGSFCGGVSWEGSGVEGGGLAWEGRGWGGGARHSVIVAGNLDDLFCGEYSRNVRFFFLGNVRIRSWMMPRSLSE